MRMRSMAPPRASPVAAMPPWCNRLSAACALAVPPTQFCTLSAGSSMVPNWERAGILAALSSAMCRVGVLKGFALGVCRVVSAFCKAPQVGRNSTVLRTQLSMSTGLLPSCAALAWMARLRVTSAVGARSATSGAVPGAGGMSKRMPAIVVPAWDSSTFWSAYRLWCQAAWLLGGSAVVGRGVPQGSSPGLRGLRARAAGYCSKNWPMAPRFCSSGWDCQARRGWRRLGGRAHEAVGQGQVARNAFAGRGRPARSGGLARRIALRRRAQALYLSLICRRNGHGRLLRQSAQRQQGMAQEGADQQARNRAQPGVPGRQGVVRVHGGGSIRGSCPARRRSAPGSGAAPHRAGLAWVGAVATAGNAALGQARADRVGGSQGGAGQRQDPDRQPGGGGGWGGGGGEGGDGYGRQGGDDGGGGFEPAQDLGGQNAQGWPGCLRGFALIRHWGCVVVAGRAGLPAWRTT